MRRIKKLTSVFLAVIMALGVLTVAPFTVSAAGNTVSTAKNYTLGNTVNDSITSTNTKNCYKFTIPNSGKITLNVTANIYHSYYDIYDSNNKALWTSNDKYWNNTTEIMVMNEELNLISGTYYFVAGSWSGNTGN